jgi:septum site-determining protein MinC
MSSMTTNFSKLGSDPLLSQPIPGVQPLANVHIKAEGNHLVLMLPPELKSNPTPNSATAPKLTGVDLTWVELCQQLKQRLNAGERFWQPNTDVYLNACDRLLDGRQLQTLSDILGTAQLNLQRVLTSRRQTAVAAATAGYSVDQQTTTHSLNTAKPEPSAILAEPLYLQATVRSGVEIRHPGTVVVLGDVNAGGAIIADGDILVWGRLRGVAHAGAKGNTRCLIASLQMEPTQLRIGDQVARAPAAQPNEYHPEVAYATSTGIRIARITDFSKQPFLSQPS